MAAWHGAWLLGLLQCGLTVEVLDVLGALFECLHTDFLNEQWNLLRIFWLPPLLGIVAPVTSMEA